MDSKTIDTYKLLAKIPSLLSANVNKDKFENLIFESFWEQKFLPGSTKTILRRLQIRNQNQLTYEDSTQIKEQWRVKSKCGTKIAILKQYTSPEVEKTKQHIEIWSLKNLEMNIDLQSLDKHGTVYTQDDIFACFDWDRKENKLIYIAEKKKPKTVSFFDDQKSKDDNQINQETLIGGEYDYAESWGEQMVEKSDPVICILDFVNKQVQVIDNIPTHISPAQPILINDDEIIFIGYKNHPKRLGIIYCPNRESYLCKINMKTKKYEELTDSGLCVRSPVLSPNGLHIIFLQNKSLGPHIQCSKLMLFELDSGHVTTLIDIVADFRFGQFSGLYELRLNNRCLSDNGNTIYFSTNCGSRLQTFSFNIITKEIINISDKSWAGDFVFLDFNANILLAAKSSPSQPPIMVYATIDRENGHVQQWISVQDQIDFNFNNEISYSVVQHADCEYILMLPSNVTNPPLIVFNHGGPHSAFTTSFNIKITGFCILQYAVLLVNYRGSTGFGDNNLMSLAGKIGTQEIEETQSIVEEVMKTRQIDASRVYVTGGSHGGFITLHLIGKYPDFYKAAAVRNPVFNMPAMLDVSDIPDWLYYESGLEEYDFSRLPTSNTYERMLSLSPIIHLNKIKTPTMLMLGGCDKRVPSSQGVACHHYLKAHNVETKILWYKDSNHAMSEMQVDADSFVHTIKWFQQYL